MSMSAWRSEVCSFFFLKQKTAYERRISDWSSDVGSSDLQGRLDRLRRASCADVAEDLQQRVDGVAPLPDQPHQRQDRDGGREQREDRVVEIGRASCRGRGCQYV